MVVVTGSEVVEASLVAVVGAVACEVGSVPDDSLAVLSTAGGLESAIIENKFYYIRFVYRARSSCCGKLKFFENAYSRSGFEVLTCRI